jgi:glycolate oxidase FAD binding subunit
MACSPISAMSSGIPTHHPVGDEAIAAYVRESAETARALRILGRGTWPDAGHPVYATVNLSLAHDTGIVAYTPGDLVLTVRAGTTLREIDSVLGAHDQWLPLDPDGGRDGTIGATVATGSYGPMAALYGTPRDQTLGMTAVTGLGDIVRPGGRVVKNVAGFDLTRLLVGSWGTLGVITEVTVRVRARARGANDDAAYAHMRRVMPSPYGHRTPVVTVPALSRTIKETFDPHNVLNPGIMEPSA